MDTQDVQLDIEELREAIRNDCVTFFAFYLQDELTHEVPELHIEIWNELTEIIRAVNLNQLTRHLQKLFCVPRGFAKSTVIKLGIILFLRYSRFNFVLYASKTAAISKNAIKDVVAWLTSPQEAAVFGAPVLIKNNETDGIWRYVIQTPDYGPKEIIMKSLGADQQVRGTLIDSKRPQLLIIDDCEDNDTAATPESQMKLNTWVMGNLLKASARISVRIMLGNMIKSTTLLAVTSKDRKWNPTVFGAIVRDKETGELKSLWESFFPLQELLEEYADYVSKGVGHVWIYEMMNMTMDTIFKVSMDNGIRGPRPNPDEVEAGIITLDPAFGQNAWNDESALTVHVKLKGQLMPWVVETRKGRWSEEEILNNLVEMSYYWNLTTWGIESAAAQQLLIVVFRALLKDRLIPPSTFTMIPLPSGGTAKSSRILAFAKSVGEQSYGIVDEEQELFEKLATYDPASKSHDDLCDSAAYGIVAWALAGEQIIANGNASMAFALLQNGSQQASVHQSQYVPY